MSGIYSILNKLASSESINAVVSKTAMQPMPGGQPMPPEGAPADPMQDPMMMAAQGADPAAMMAGAGMPVDPAMAVAGGAAPGGVVPAEGADPAMAGGAMPLPPEIQAAIDQAVQAATGGNGGGNSGEGGKTGGKAQKTEEALAGINAKLDKVIGFLIGSGKITPEEAEDVEAVGTPTPEMAAQPMIPDEMLGAAVEKGASDDNSKTDILSAMSTLRSFVDSQNRS